MKKIHILLFLLIVSCTTTKTDYPIAIFTREAVSVTQPVAEVLYKYDEDENQKIYCIYVYNDSIYIKQYDFNPASKNLIVFCNLKDSSQNRGYLTYGKGNMETLGGFSFFNDHYITVSDVEGSRSVYLFDIDSAFNQNYVPRLIKNIEVFGNLVVLKNEDVIYANHYFFDYHSGNVVYNKDAKRIIKLEKEKNYLLKHINYADFTQNIGDCVIGANEEKNSIISASKQYPEITIMDTLFQVKRVLLGPDKFDLIYTKDESGNIKGNQKGYSYLSGCSTNNFIYLAYEGYNGSLDDYFQKKPSCEVIKMDWDGNIKHIYKLDGLFFDMSVIDDKELYGTITIDRKDIFVRYEL